MKYRDKNSFKFQKENNNSSSARRSNRKDDIYYSKVYDKFFLNRFDRDWWTCLSNIDKDDIISNYDIQLEFLNSNGKMWTTAEVFDKMTDWFQWVKDSYKPNFAKLREIKLKKIGV